MNELCFDFIRLFLYEQTGIVVRQDKDYLLEARLSLLAKELNFDSINDLVTTFKKEPTDFLKLKIIESITTHETFFFRDPNLFDHLHQHIIPDLIERKKNEKKINIWCAAASSGQEPYTIAMILSEHAAQLKNWNINFVASDLSEKILEKARSGIYTQFEINRGLPIAYLLKYFEKTEAQWQIKNEVRRMISFSKINLTKPWSLGHQDLIFMRNVLIYFDDETKKNILVRLQKVLGADGYLFLGGSETTIGLSDYFQRINIKNSSCYQVKKWQNPYKRSQN
jgi:chemotaxis protein methyltransferase CheR